MIIRFSIEPSFAEHTAIDIVLSESDGKWVLSGHHGGYLGDKKIKKTIPSSKVQKMMKGLADVKITPIPESSMGLDGTTYRLELQDGFNSTSYCWWEATPEGYKPLEQLGDTLLHWAGIN